ncbi:hypothetical protein NPIL_165421 [Nephila pilipes]|uniref:Uncharacterized protein n=1 Tax=Nephila pilipes TaxID=299642 RepID=A0A8X6TF62_NEPPI|nr:hypothetical protein NPIL_165421 [Nephila pilipes]
MENIPKIHAKGGPRKIRTASWIQYRRHKAISSDPKSDYLAFRITMQEYLFHGSEEGDTSEYEPSEPPSPQKKKINAKVPLLSDHLRKKKNCIFRKFLDQYQKTDAECLVANETQQK